MDQKPDIHVALSRIQGKSAWGLRRDLGSIFFLEFGNPVSRVEHIRSHGEWHFLIELCHWRFETSGSVIVGSEDDPGFIDSTFCSLNLGLVQTAEVILPSHDLCVTFSSGTTFKTFSTSAQASDQWTQWLLFGPGEYSWVSDGGGQIRCIQGDEPVRTSHS